jgi:hypothetical protein
MGLKRFKTTTKRKNLQTNNISMAYPVCFLEANKKVNILISTKKLVNKQAMTPKDDSLFV